MKHPAIADRLLKPLTVRRSYQERQKILLTRFIAASALVHLAVLALPAWTTSAPRVLVVPPLQASLQQTTASKPVNTIDAENTSHRSSTAALAVTAEPGQAPAGPAEATTASSAPSGEAERLNHLQTLLRGALDRQFVYPPLARRHGWQGKVELTAEFGADGRLQNMRVLRSSGYSILDQDALATLARIGEFPQVRDWLSGRGYQVALPIVYRLVEG